MRSKRSVPTDDVRPGRQATLRQATLRQATLREEKMEDVQEVDGLEEAEGRRLLAAAFEAAPAGTALASNGSAGWELLHQVRRRTTRQRRRTRALVPAGAVAALGGVAAVAVTLTATVASAPSAFAAVTAAAAKTSAGSFTVTVTEQDQFWSKKKLTFRMNGAFDPKRGIGIAYYGYPAKDKILIVKGHIYSPVHQQGRKPWAEAWVPPKSLPPSEPGSIVGFAADQPIDPSALLSQLKSAGSVTDEGPTSGPGWTGTKYGITEQGTWHHISFSEVGTVSVDSHGLVRRLVTTSTWNSPHLDPLVQTDDISYSGFGVKVSVTAPPASQVENYPYGAISISL
jgi:hypothetical protein